MEKQRENREEDSPVAIQPDGEGAGSSRPNPEGSLISGNQLNGQYFVYVGYGSGRKRVRRTAISSSIKEIKSRSGRNVADEEAQAAFATILGEYGRISGYAIVADQAAQEVSVLPRIRLRYELDEQVGDTLEHLSKRPSYDLFVSKSLDIKNTRKSIDKYWHSVTNSFAVQSAIFVGMITVFDEALAKLIRNALVHVPELMNSFGSQISYKDIVAAGNFEELRATIVSQTVDELMWRGRDEQIAWIEKAITKTKISDVIPSYDKFIEITERRNIYVHNSGIVNDVYLSKVPKSAFDGGIAPLKGDRLKLQSSYFLDAADVLIESFVVISQSVVRKLMRNATEDQKENIDTEFNQSIYLQLESGRFESAARLARSMLSNSFKVSDLVSKMGAINLAIARKKVSDKAGVDAVIKSVDWSSSRNEFHVCIEAIRENESEVCRLIETLKGSDFIGPHAYFEWPAFDWMRSKPAFWEKLQEVYGDDIRFVLKEGEANSSPSRAAD